VPSLSFYVDMNISTLTHVTHRREMRSTDPANPDIPDLLQSLLIAGELKGT